MHITSPHCFRFHVLVGFCTNILLLLTEECSSYDFKTDFFFFHLYFCIGSHKSETIKFFHFIPLIQTTKVGKKNPPYPVCTRLLNFCY
jgi:hypothetical protein